MSVSLYVYTVDLPTRKIISTRENIFQKRRMLQSNRLPADERRCCIYNGLNIDGIGHQAKEFALTANFKGADVVSVGRLVPLGA
jgi:hypothetical protein